MQQLQTLKDGDRKALVPLNDKHFGGKDKKGRPLWKDYQYDRLVAAYHHITDYSVAVDVGAHVGLISQRLAERFGTVYAFEPDPQNFLCLWHNTRFLTPVLRVPMALGDKTATGGIDRGKGENSGDVCIDPKGTGVDIMALDDYDLPDLGLLKIDVQGYEHLVLEGARKLIQAFAPVVIVECEEPGKLRRDYSKGKDLVGAFFAQEHWDYRLVAKVGHDRIYAPGPNGARPYTKYAIRGDYHWQQNIPGKVMGKCIKEVTDYINAQKHEAVLDVGCGDGHCTSMLKNAFGTDDNGTALALARRHGIPCAQLSAYRLQYLGRQFGGVCMLDVLEHLPRQEQALRIAAQVGDNLYILNPDPVGTHWHASEFTDEALLKFVTANGWQVKYHKRYEMSDDNKKTFVHLVKP